MAIAASDLTTYVKPHVKLAVFHYVVLGVHSRCDGSRMLEFTATASVCFIKASYLKLTFVDSCAASAARCPLGLFVTLCHLIAIYPIGKTTRQVVLVAAVARETWGLRGDATSGSMRLYHTVGEWCIACTPFLKGFSPIIV
jgi:hypothetical protein